MKEQREEAYYDKIKHGRMRAWIYFTGKGGRPAYEVKCFRFEKPSERSKWRKNYRYSHVRTTGQNSYSMAESQGVIASLPVGRQAERSNLCLLQRLLRRSRSSQ